MLLKNSSLLRQDYEINMVAEVRPYSTKELSGFYQVPGKTFLKWLRPFKPDIGSKRGRFYTVKQVEIIFERLGIPYRLSEKT